VVAAHVAPPLSLQICSANIRGWRRGPELVNVLSADVTRVGWSYDPDRPGGPAHRALQGGAPVEVRAVLAAPLLLPRGKVIFCLHRVLHT